ncbi:hypothetical protein [Mesorhizobium tianshanense]|uniref:hypothetical protein n=1 Tax=Mesorhizobium tianshanense TaxID=39844 RepID=UPI001F0A35BF|nr:hypothetical protein [Mesorhizobium tianshanense]
MNRLEQPSPVQPWLVWAFAIWGDVPRREVFLALIVATGLLIIGNEHFRKRM